jgi:antitoxin (DNA-binding transcriptional repressor) of toxin-antitoxin stability system
MQVTITTLRQRLFELTDRALEGESIQFSYKGRLFRILPQEKRPKLSRLTGETVVSVGGLDQAGKDLMKEMEAEWEQDWSEL